MPTIVRSLSSTLTDNEFEFEELNSVVLHELGKIEAHVTPKDGISPKVLVRWV